MFACGAEEPIQFNEMLRSYNERPVGALHELSRFVDPRLNRYSFVWFGRDQYAADFTFLLTAILDQWNADLTWARRLPYYPPGTGATRIAAFRHRHMAASRLQHNGNADADIETKGHIAEEESRAALARLSDEGWSAFHDDELIVATKRAKCAEEISATLTLDRRAWSFLLLGAAPSPETFHALRYGLRYSLRQEQSISAFDRADNFLLGWPSASTSSATWKVTFLAAPASLSSGRGGLTWKHCARRVSLHASRRPRPMYGGTARHSL